MEACFTPMTQGFTHERFGMRKVIKTYSGSSATPRWFKLALLLLVTYLLGVLTPRMLAAGMLSLSPLTPESWAQSSPATPQALSPQQRYAADIKLCADEPSSTARLQCRRDAKTELDTSNAALKNVAKPSAVACPDCGRVSAVSITEKEGEGSALGMIGGGLVGGLIGNQMGGGIGKDIATVAGAVGGAYAGKEIEKRAKTHKLWSVSVRFDSGNTAKFDFNEDPGYAVGDAVQRSGNTLVRR